jgi:hypothetical protein
MKQRYRHQHSDTTVLVSLIVSIAMIVLTVLNFWLG